MNRHTHTIIDYLDDASIHTWFDIGYFLDQLKNVKSLRSVKPIGDLERLHKRMQQGVAFVTFDIGLDGVTIEMSKYATALRRILGNTTPIHWIAGEIDTSVEYIQKSPHNHIYEYPLIKGFEKWGDTYYRLFHTKLKRGDDDYNKLPEKIWLDTKTICQNLLQYIENNNIELIVTTNTASNPGNLSLILALVIISELYDIKVISSNHDFYWEGGSLRKAGEASGPRDHFFKNADIGEIFSLIQTLYPWNSSKWIHANINSLQSKTMLKNLGFNPFNVTELTSAIDTQVFRRLSSTEKNNAYQKLTLLFKKDGAVIRPEEKGYFNILATNQPTVISNSKHSISFDSKTILFLQPTRIIERKNIEKDFVLIEQLITQSSLKNSSATIVLLITGPVTPGSEKYARKLLIRIRALFHQLRKIDHRVFVAFKKGKDFGNGFKEKNLSSLSISELYGVATSVLLPSDQEGRGLPILESAASEVPLIVKRFEPDEVYREVLGLDFSDDKRLKVLEFPKDKVTQIFLQSVCEMLLDSDSRNNLIKHNHQVILNRYSMEKLTENFSQILEKIWLIQGNHTRHKIQATEAVNYIMKDRSVGENALVYDKNRVYIPGILKYRFLSQVKSIIDPSYFRIEEKETYSDIFKHARTVIPSNPPKTSEELFYYAIEEIFKVKRGKYEVELDTTFDYRYRDNTRYLWREMTEPQLLGVITKLAEDIFNVSKERSSIDRFIDLARNCSRDKILMTEMKAHQAQSMALDLDVTSLDKEGDQPDPVQISREYIVQQLQIPMPIHDWRLFQKRVLDKPQALVIFPGTRSEIVWELFIYDRLIEQWNRKKDPYTITFACREEEYYSEITTAELKKILQSDTFANLTSAFGQGMVQIVPIGSRSSSVDLYQISPELRQALLTVKHTDGHVLAKGEQNYFSLDILDINSFRYGTIHRLSAQAVSNMPDNTRFLQFVPAGLRTFFGFPLTVETPHQFSRSLNGIYNFDDTDGNKQLLTELKLYLDEHGTSLRSAVSTMNQKQKYGNVTVKRLAGKYADGYAWTGVAAYLSLDHKDYSYHILSSKRNKTLPQFVHTIERRARGKVIMGWNGGYILNNELVGKLNISEDFIGTPLGFVVSNGRVTSLPLFNRPVFGVRKDGKVLIDTIKFNFSGRVFHKNAKLWEWKKEYINPKKIPENDVAVYTPLSGLKKIPITDRIIIVLGGRKVMRVLYPDSQHNNITLFAGGITFSVPLSMKSKIQHLKPNTEVTFDLDLPEIWAGVTEAIEAGPLLIKNARHALNLSREGWLLPHSIRTQAARRDRENERGPRIGCGISKSGNLVCVVVESRIRESVGATYKELAHVLMQEGARVAMGFDPGGSASLWAPGGVMNIVPYTSTYNEKPLTGKPEARPVTNAVLVRTIEG